MRTATLTVIYLLISPLFAATFEERHSHEVAANPPDLQFRLSTSDSADGYHIGERIMVTLAFSSNSPDKYKLNGATYDRGGRLPCEQFILESDNVVDPYQDYFGTGVLGGLMGGLRGYPVLGPEPYTIDLDLTSWFRFDKPGRYRLFLKSHRLTRERAQDEPGGERAVDFAAVSNVLEIKILPPDPAWEAAKLAQLRGVLMPQGPELPKADGPSIPINPDEDKTRLAWNELRCLATTGAVELMLDATRKHGGPIDALTLLGARDRAAATEAFDRYLSDPAVPFVEWDVRVRALLTFVAKDAPSPLPYMPWQAPDRTKWPELQAASAERRKRFIGFVRSEALRLIPIVQQQTTAARRVSAQAIAAIVPEEARAAGIVPRDDYGLSREELVAQFLAFPQEQQAALLGKKWDLVRGPEMVPVLLSLVEKVKQDPPESETEKLRVWGVEMGVEQAAMRRLNELAPAVATTFLRKHLAAGRRRFAGYAVRNLPAQEIPEADAAFSAALDKNLAAVPLVEKFASARLLPQMRKLYATQEGPCTGEFLAYFVRVLSPDAPDEAKAMMRDAMGANYKHNCFPGVLASVANVVWNPVVEAVAREMLSDSNPAAVANAAKLLAERGGPSMQPLLWKRLEQWSEEWRGRAKELSVDPIAGKLPNENATLGRILFDAVGNSAPCIVDEACHRRLAAHCIDAKCREVWEARPATSNLSIRVNSGGELYPSGYCLLNQCYDSLDRLKDYLHQFAAGTKFRWQTEESDPFEAFSPGQLREFYEDLSAFLAKHGMSIEPVARRD